MSRKTSTTSDHEGDMDSAEETSEMQNLTSEQLNQDITRMYARARTLEEMQAVSVVSATMLREAMERCDQTRQSKSNPSNKAHDSPASLRDVSEIRTNATAFTPFQPTATQLFSSNDEPAETTEQDQQKPKNHSCTFI